VFSVARRSSETSPTCELVSTFISLLNLPTPKLTAFVLAYNLSLPTTSAPIYLRARANYTKKHSHEPLIPSINTKPQQPPHKLHQTLLPTPHLRHIQPEKLLQLLWRMALYKGCSRPTSRDSQTMAGVLGC
jgi:hypothetical protein